MALLNVLHYDGIKEQKLRDVKKSRMKAKGEKEISELVSLILPGKAVFFLS